MPRLIWTPSALADVQRLYRFLAHKDLGAAKRAASAIRKGVNLLVHQPHLGRPATDMDPEWREWLIDFGSSGYVALYRAERETIAILAVRHQKEAGY